MFHYENRHMKITNPIVRNFKSLQWVLIMMCATLLNPNQPNQCFIASPVRAREREMHAPKKSILGGMSRASYRDNVTVYSYNRYIKSTNSIVRHVMSLTRTLEQILVGQCAPKHAKTQPLHGSNTRARAPNLMPP